MTRLKPPSASAEYCKVIGADAPLRPGEQPHKCGVVRAVEHPQHAQDLDDLRQMQHRAKRGRSRWDTRFAQLQGHGLSAIVEISLDHQGAEHLAAFEAKAVAEALVQQCWRVSPGPDFVLVVHVPDMPGYHALAQRLFTQDANVRNVRAFFATHRAKFDPSVQISLE